jgi:hypothetical protein
MRLLFLDPDHLPSGRLTVAETGRDGQLRLGQIAQRGLEGDSATPFL